MRRVIIESPYAGDIRGNTEYLKRCLRDSIDCGEAPLASHLIYPFVLREDLKDQRQLGIELGYEWWAAADRIVFYMDKGLSIGMQRAIERARRLGKTIEFRTLSGSPPWLNRIEQLSAWQRFKRWWQQPVEPNLRYAQIANTAGTIQEPARESPETSSENSERQPENEEARFINDTLSAGEPSPFEFRMGPPERDLSPYSPFFKPEGEHGPTVKK